jgi:inorganic pyrophosphatase
MAPLVVGDGGGMAGTFATETVEVVIETPRGSRNKYEHDLEQDVMRLDRRLPGSFAFPADYGYVPETTGSDGEPLDALVLTVEPTYPGVRVTARAIGVVWIRTRDRREAKLVCVPEGEPAYRDVGTITELPEHLRAEVENFFDIYRSLDEHSDARSDGIEGATAAQNVLTDARGSK